MISSVALALEKAVAKVEQLLARDRIEADLVEEAQQPRLAGLERVGHAVGVPHLAGAPEELIAAGALHAVDAQIGAADADDVLRRPGAGRIVFRRDQAVARIDRRRHRRAEIDVAEAEHEIARVEDDALHLLDRCRGR